MNIRRVGKYEIISTIGKGPLGVVSKARDPETGELVAVKTMKLVDMRGSETDADVIKRFKRESAAVRDLKHANIIVILESGYIDDGNLFIVMEYAEGESLASIISRRSSLSSDEIIHYLAQIASALDYAHSRDVIHSDIKPSNIIIDSEHNIQVLDFGVARFSDTLLASSGSILESPSYMSPEQICGEPLDDTADIFALGVIAFELFTFNRPFAGKGYTSVVNSILHKAPLSIAQTGKKLAPGIESILHQCLSKQRKQRYASGLEFVDELARVLDIVVDGTGIVGGLTLEQEVDAGQISHCSKVVVSTEAEETRVSSDESEQVGNRRLAVQLSNNDKIAPDNAVHELASTGSTVIREALSGTSESAHVTDSTVFAQSHAESKDEATAVFSANLRYLIGLCFIAVGVVLVGAYVGEDGPPVSDNKENLVKEDVPSVAYAFDGANVSKITDDELVDRLRVENLEVLRVTIPDVANRESPEITLALGILAKHESALVRIEVVKALSLKPHNERDETIIVLSELLGDDDYLVRGFAAKVLGDIGGLRGFLPLKSRLEVEENTTVRSILLKAVGDE